MAITPGVYNFDIRRRSDHTERFEFCDDTGEPVILTGWSAKAQGWTESRDNKLFDFEVTGNWSQGAVSIFVSSAITTGLPKEFQYDLLLTNPSGLKEYYIAGTITTQEGYTE